jgi:hypothetical protein
MIQCVRCGHHCKNEIYFQKHCTTIRKCVAKYIFIPKEIYVKNYESLNKFFYSKFMLADKLKYGCYKCGKLYKDRSYYFKHIKKCVSKHVLLNEHETNTKLILYDYDNFIPDIVLGLPETTKLNILANPDESLFKLFNIFQISLPENQNMYIRGYKEKYGYTYKNGHWIQMPIHQLLNFLITKLIKWLYLILFHTNTNTNNFAQSSFHFEKLFTEPLYIKKFTNNLKIAFYHNRNKIKYNYEQRSGLEVKYNMTLKNNK